MLADVRTGNLARMINELQNADALSRAELARKSGISVATAHRLIPDLVDLGLVQRLPAADGGARLGRPPVVYQFRDEVALLAAADVGNETTRLAVTTLSGRVIAEASISSDRLGRSVAGTLASRIRGLIGHVRETHGRPGKAIRAGQPGRPLAGAGVGIAAAVDAEGVLRAPPVHGSWDGVPLRASLAALLGCQVLVAQDDHLSPIAESSDQGTFPARRRCSCSSSGAASASV